MTQRMAGRRPEDAGASHGKLHRPLKAILYLVMAANGAAARVDRSLGSGQPVLPAPFLIGKAIFSVQRVRHLDGAEAFCQVMNVSQPNLRDVHLQRLY